VPVVAACSEELQAAAARPRATAGTIQRRIYFLLMGVNVDQDKPRMRTHVP
jgi:hypothetical protein